MLSAALLLGGCGSTAASGGNSGNNSAGTDVTKDKTKDTADKTKKAPEIEGLTYESTMDLTYATYCCDPAADREYLYGGDSIHVSV